MDDKLRIRADAMRYLRAKRDSGIFKTDVLFVGAMLDAVSIVDSELSPKQLMELASALKAGLPERPTVRWMVWIADGRNVHPSHVHEVEGIPVAVPPQVLEQIGSRELIVEQGELRFHPEQGRLAPLST